LEKEGISIGAEIWALPFTLISQKVFTPVETGVQDVYKPLKILDSGFRRNDKKWPCQTSYEVIFLKITLSRGKRIFY